MIFSLPKHITIIGLGLLGSSLARKLREVAPTCHITGCNHTQAALDRALSLQLIDTATTDLASSVSTADIVILCTPLGTYDSCARTLAPHLKPGAILTDVGSVKHYAIETIVPHLSPVQQALFVAGHPIAGSEKSGVDAGSAALFEGKKVILTPLPFTDPTATQTITALWTLMGAHVELLDASLHDRIYAHVSHLVQLVITCYAQIAERQQSEVFTRFIRIAGSNPAMWRDIIMANRVSILEAMDSFRRALLHLRSTCEQQGNIIHSFQTTRDIRLALEPSLTQQNNALVEYTVPQCIASCLIKTTPAPYLSYAGSGFRDATSILITAALPTDNMMYAHTPIIYETLTRFLTVFDTATTAVETLSNHALEEILTSSIP